MLSSSKGIRNLLKSSLSYKSNKKDHLFIATPVESIED